MRFAKNDAEDRRARFEFWFVKPLWALRVLEDDAGGFIALSVALSLFERHARSRIKHDLGRNSEDGDVTKALKDQYGFSNDQALAFWELVRHGMLHRGMPKAIGKFGDKWMIKPSSAASIRYDATERRFVINVWLFVREVLDLYEKRPELIDDLECPLAVVFTAP